MISKPMRHEKNVGETGCLEPAFKQNTIDDGSTRRSEQVWMKERRSEVNYSIQNPKYGRILTTDRQQAAGWVEHFKNVLNQPFPLNTVAPPPASKDLEISANTQTIREVADPIRSLKNDKAPTLMLSR